MTSPSIKVDGAKQLRTALKAASDGTADLKDTHKAAAEIVVVDAKPRARRKSGRMAASTRGAGQAGQAVVRVGFVSLPWVLPQVFGSPKQNISPNPFPFDARDARLPDVIERYERGVDEEMKKHGLR